MADAEPPDVEREGGLYLLCRQHVLEVVGHRVAAGVAVVDAAERVFDAIDRDRWTHLEVAKAVLRRGVRIHVAMPKSGPNRSRSG